MSKFLEEWQESTDRVFMIDPSDCYFQRDPFELLNFEGMGFFDHGLRFQEETSPRSWVEECFTKTAGFEVANRTVIHSGAIFGTVKEFTAFEAVLQKRKYWRHCYEDWPIINVLVARGLLEAEGIPYKVFSCKGPVLSAEKCPHRIAEAVVNYAGVESHVLYGWKKMPNIKALYQRSCDLPDRA
jgi:hypothetical protein